MRMSSFFQAAPGDGAPAGGAAPAAAAAPGAVAAPPAAAATPPPQGSSLAPPAAAAPGTAPIAGLEWLQPKYVVKAADGKVDEAASIRKQAEAYAPLSKRIGSDELRPEKPADYKIVAPQGVEAALFDEFVKDAETQAFVAKAHELGLNNSQVNFAIESFLKTVPQLLQEDAGTRDAETKAYLKANIWKDDAAMSVGMTSAFEAGAKLGLDNAALTQPFKMGNGVTLPPLINHPLLLKALSAIAPQLGEGKPANTGATLPATDLDALTKSKAYMDPKHPDHLATKQKVAAHFANQPGGANKPSGPFIVTP